MEDEVKCNSCGWTGLEDDLLTEFYYYDDELLIGYCPECMSEDIESIT